MNHYKPHQRSWKFMAVLQFLNFTSQTTDRPKFVANFHSSAGSCPAPAKPPVDPSHCALQKQPLLHRFSLLRPRLTQSWKEVGFLLMMRRIKSSKDSLTWSGCEEGVWDACCLLEHSAVFQKEILEQLAWYLLGEELKKYISRQQNSGYRDEPSHSTPNH